MSENKFYAKSCRWPRVQSKLDIITGWARVGLTDTQIAENLQVPYREFKVMVKNEEALIEALFLGRQAAEITVENALYKRAIGFVYDEVVRERSKVYDEDNQWTGEYRMEKTKSTRKTSLGDVSAQIYWLEHRAPSRWSKIPDKVEETFDDGFIDALKLSASEVWDNDDN